MFNSKAANCILGKYTRNQLLPRDVLALFGAHDLDKTYEVGRTALSPKKIFIHEDWNVHTTNYDADVSLLQFEEEGLYFSAYIQPICIFDYEREPVVTEGIVTGWGQSEDLTKQHENLPKFMKVLIETYENCFLQDHKLIYISSRRTFCAGLRNGTGVCKGDSGGGLFIKVNGIYYLKGIVSSSLLNDYGNDCDVFKNAVYTNVPKFYSWIKQITEIEHSVCGTVKRMTALMKFGQSFQRGSFPWLVALFHLENNKSEFICGGTIISSSYVLSGNV